MTPCNACTQRLEPYYAEVLDIKNYTMNAVMVLRQFSLKEEIIFG